MRLAQLEAKLEALSERVTQIEERLRIAGVAYPRPAGLAPDHHAFRRRRKAATPRR